MKGDTKKRQPYKKKQSINKNIDILVDNNDLERIDRNSVVMAVDIVHDLKVMVFSTSVIIRNESDHIDNLRSFYGSGHLCLCNSCREISNLQKTQSLVSNTHSFHPRCSHVDHALEYNSIEQLNFYSSYILKNIDQIVPKPISNPKCVRTAYKKMHLKTINRNLKYTMHNCPVFSNFNQFSTNDRVVGTVLDHILELMAYRGLMGVSLLNCIEPNQTRVSQLRETTNEGDIQTFKTDFQLVCDGSTTDQNQVLLCIQQNLPDRLKLPRERSMSFRDDLDDRDLLSIYQSYIKDADDNWKSDQKFFPFMGVQMRDLDYHIQKIGDSAGSDFMKSVLDKSRKNFVAIIILQFRMGWLNHVLHDKLFESNVLDRLHTLQNFNQAVNRVSQKSINKKEKRDKFLEIKSRMLKESNSLLLDNGVVAPSSTCKELTDFINMYQKFYRREGHGNWRPCSKAAFKKLISKSKKFGKSFKYISRFLTPAMKLNDLKSHADKANYLIDYICKSSNTESRQFNLSERERICLERILVECYIKT